MTIRSLAAVLLGVACLVLAARDASASIVSSGGSIAIQTAPSGTLTNDTLESSTLVRGWFEKTVTLTSNLSVSHQGSGTVSSNASANGGTISSGTRLDSYLFHFDKVGSSNATVSLTNSGGSLSVTFSTAIQGVFFSQSGLNGSDATFGPGGLTYSGANRGVEFGSENDNFTISSDLRTITFNSLTVNGSKMDQVRVLVLGAVSTPEPGTWALFGLGALGLAFHVRSRRRAARKPPACMA